MSKSLLSENGLIDLKKKIQKHLDRGNSRLVWLEGKISNDKNRQTLKEEFSKAKDKLAGLRKKFNHYQEKAEQYTQKNPKKALAMATTAGLLAGGLLASLRGKNKTASRPKALKRTSKLKPTRSK
jgi:predicted  nucleic acid-binding Zn-ribbon protein